MSEPEFTGLILPRASVHQEALNCCASSLSFCLADLPHWESVISDPMRNPKGHLRRQRQIRNDCRGNSGSTSAEALIGKVQGWDKKEELSATYFYQACEYIDRGRVGMDQGSSISAGAQLLTKGIPKLGVGPGVPTEADWPYRSYERSTRNFISRAKKVPLVEIPLVEAISNPSWEDALAIAITGALDWGTGWSLKWDRERVVRTYRGHGRGGHATAGVFARMHRGEPQLEILNSHLSEAEARDEDSGYYWVDQQGYEEIVRESRFGVFGYVAAGAVERFASIDDWTDAHSTRTV